MPFVAVFRISFVKLSDPSDTNLISTLKEYVLPSSHFIPSGISILHGWCYFLHFVSPVPKPFSGNFISFRFCTKGNIQYITELLPEILSQRNYSAVIRSSGVGKDTTETQQQGLELIDKLKKMQDLPWLPTGLLPTPFEALKKRLLARIQYR